MSERDTNADQRKSMEPKERPAKAAAWRRRLYDESTGDRGALARLRRAASWSDAWAEAETARLYAALGFSSLERERRMETVGLLAILLAHVREDLGDATLGGKLGGADGVMSDLRVRRLTAARDAAETLRGFREAIALLKNTAPAADLARCVLGWLDPDRRDAARTRFLFDYHGAGASAPSDVEDDSHSDDAKETV